MYMKTWQLIFLHPTIKKNDSHEPSFDDERVTVNPEVSVALKAFADAGLMSTAFFHRMERNEFTQYH